MHICLFDIDGTLILTDGAGQKAFARTFTEEFGIGRWNGKVEFSGRSDRAIVADLFSDFGIANTEENWERFAVGYIQRLPETLAERNGRILPGIEPLLKTLDSRSDVAVGLLTGNIRAGSFQKLQHFGLADYFSFGGYGDLHADRNQIAASALDAAKAHLGAIGQARLLRGMPGSRDRDGYRDIDRIPESPNHESQNPYPRNDSEITSAFSSPSPRPLPLGEREQGEVILEPFLRNHHPFQSLLVIGDTPNDIRCARSIDAIAIAVATGFSPYEDLVAAQPDILLADLSDPTPLLKILD